MNDFAADRRAGLLLGHLLVALSLASCGEQFNPARATLNVESGNRSAQATIFGEASSILPSEKLADWTSYGDQVSLVTLSDERTIEPPTEERARGEGYIGRTVTLNVTRTIWTRPGAPHLDHPVDITVAGWVKRQSAPPVPAAVGGDPRPETGRRYLMPIVRYDDGKWGPLGSSAIMETDPQGVIKAQSPSSAARSLDGKSIEGAAALLRGTLPYPLAVKYAQLPPRERFDAVALEEMRKRTPLPSPPAKAATSGQ